MGYVCTGWDIALLRLADASAKLNLCLLTEALSEPGYLFDPVKEN